MNSMKGTLHKWTNYISGWQPRWFVLESGVLSYYISPEEVTQGSRRSYKAASCHINVDKHDELRLQVVTPDKDTLYLRAGDKTEKQRWVVALASAKLEDHQVDAPDRQEAVPKGPPTKSKSTQLRETCNHLLTQVQGIKMAATQTPPDVESLQAMASTLSIRCDDFLRLTQECLELSHTHSAPVTPVGVGGNINFIGISSRAKRGSASDDEARLQRPRHKQHSPTSSLPTHLTISHSKSDKEKEKNEASKATEQSKENIEISAHGSPEVFITPTNSPHDSPPPSPTPQTHTPTQVQLHSPPTPPIPDFHTPTHPQLHTIRSRAIANQNQRPMFVNVQQQDIAQDRKCDTFFSRSTCQFGAIVLEEDDLIPTKVFLECAEALLPFFDVLSPTAFAPVKADLGGNVKKTLGKYEEDPTRYTTLQVMMTHEIETDTAGTDSATESLLWLKRGMEFIYLFLAELARGETAMDIAAGKAYSKSLSRHHNWMVRGMFSFATKALPYHPDFMVLLGADRSDESVQQVIQDMGIFAQNLGEICVILDQFLVRKNIETES